MLGLKLNHVSKRGHRPQWGKLCITDNLCIWQNQTTTYSHNPLITWKGCNFCVPRISFQKLCSAFLSARPVLRSMSEWVLQINYFLCWDFPHGLNIWLLSRESNSKTTMMHRKCVGGGDISDGNNDMHLAYKPSASLYLKEKCLPLPTLFIYSLFFMDRFGFVFNLRGFTVTTIPSSILQPPLWFEILSLIITSL